MAEKDKKSQAQKIADAWGVTQVVIQTNDEDTNRPNQKKISEAQNDLEALTNGERRDILSDAEALINQARGNDDKIVRIPQKKTPLCSGGQESISLLFG